VNARLGIIDWGIGGLGVVRELHVFYTHKTPDLPVISYLSDTGAPPYGTLSARELEARLRKAVAFLRTRDASSILLACNAASTALPNLGDLENVSGVIEPTIELVAKNKKWRRIAVIGGRRTILSRVYANALRARGFDVAQKIAQPLSGMIERGEQASPKFQTAVRTILRGTHDCDALLLACTHYPAAMPVFENSFRGHVIDPLSAIARSLEKPASIRAHALDEFFTTGDARAMRHAAASAWGDTFARMTPKKISL
jgi:glutamate racemase